MLFLKNINLFNHSAQT